MLNRGGQRVGKGTYWDMSTGRRIEMEQEGVLPGERKNIYIKASSAAVLMAGPVLGLLFAVFLPFIGIAMTLVLVGKKLAASVAHVATSSASFGWRPIEAYLTGKKERKEAREKKNSGKK